MSVWIKICANTSVEDAKGAVAAGADALGFIFAPSSRKMDAASVGAISEHVADVERIGVFVNERPERIAETARIAKLTGVQLQGIELPQEVEEIRGRLTAAFSSGRGSSGNNGPRNDKGRKFRVIKALHYSGHSFALLEKFRESPAIDALLLDTYSPSQSGGTGKSFDWRAARAALESVSKPIIVAGGLNAQNVLEALEIFSPWGVDVVSGVEREPGKKDQAKVRAFCDVVRSHHGCAATSANRKERI
jgi:phosphoribosylanthranilate isomerase